MPTRPAQRLRAALERWLALAPEARPAWLDPLESPAREHLVQLLAGPDPVGAAQLALGLPEPLLVALAEPGCPAALIALLHQGSYPARLMRLLEPARVLEVLADEAPASRAPAARIEAALAEPGGSAAEAIARVRTEVYLALARRELEHAPLEEVGRRLSELAGAVIHAALRAVDPTLVDQVCVFGMGKLGGAELNFLSDIDLVFAHSEEAVAAEDEAGVHRLRTRLHDKLRRALRLIEGSGVWRPLFHVDLRLRPFGSRGPLSLSPAAIERYYERHGRSWERQAWLRARPVAGNLALGEELLARLTPFVWPRNLAPTVFEEISAMMKRARAQAHASIGSASVDLKHDAGGIREIEFFVQSLQLLGGGRDPNLRTRTTLGACDRLATAGLLSDREHEILARAYRVLRRIEHRVQLVEGQQTHRVPGPIEARACLARRLAVDAPPTWLVGAERELSDASEPEPPDSLADFDAALAELRAQVQAITADFTGESELVGERSSQREVAQAVVIDPGSSPRSRRGALASFGLAPEAREEVAALLEHLLSRQHGALTSSGAAHLGARKLLLACLDSASPVDAVQRFVEFSASRPAHLGVWRLMAEAEHTALVSRLADLFGTSQPLSRALINFAGTVGPARDGGLSLLLEANASGLTDAAALRERFASFRAGAPDAELDGLLVVFKARELVRIGIYDLARRPDALAIGRSLSDLADLVVQEVLADLATGYREGPGFTLAVLTLGKFGMQAMDYGSDLDLMFVFEPEPNVAPTLVRDAAQRVSRKLIGRLEDRRRGLRLYEVDMRLRPSGRQGLLVTSLTGFRSYHERALEVWERLALVRLRAVAEQRFEPGDPGPADATGIPAHPGALAQAVVEDIVPGSVWTEDPRGHVAAHTRRLKQRIEDELARESRDQWNIKTGSGGCLELELLLSALQLEHGIRAREIPTALRRLHEAGVLDPAEARALDRAYRFQRRLLNRLRMSRDSGWAEVDRLPLNSPRLTALARRMGLADRDALISTLDRERAIIRAAFARHLPLDRTHVGVH